MPARGSRLACSLRSGGGCQGAFDVYPGEQPGAVAKVDPVNWDKPPQGPVVYGPFKVIDDAQLILKRGK
jgi:hypothetical protein